MANRKLVLDEENGTVLMSVSTRDCDFVSKTVAGGIEAALESVPALLTRAQEKWAESPRNPAYTPPKTPSRARTPAPAAGATATGDLPLLSGTGLAPGSEAPAAPTEAPTEVTPQASTEAGAAAPAPETAEAPATFEKPAGQWEYMLKDGRGPYPDIQAAIDDMGMDVQDRPHHNRWDRLSAQLKEQVLRRPKQS